VIDKTVTQIQNFISAGKHAATTAHASGGTCRGRRWGYATTHPAARGPTPAAKPRK
jgi:hypothetical protein